MLRFDVLVIVGNIGESIRAKRASVRILLPVGFQMNFQFAQSNAFLSANGAGILLERFFSSVLSQMD